MEVNQSWMAVNITDFEGSMNRSIALNGSGSVEGQPTHGDDYWQHRAAEILWVYFSPVIILLGVVSNTISLVVLNTATFRKTSLGFLLSALAVVDNLILLTPFLRQWIRYVTPDNVDVRQLSAGGCYVHFFLSYLLPQVGILKLKFEIHVLTEV